MNNKSAKSKKRIIRATGLIVVDGRLVTKILDREPKRNSLGEIIESYATITTTFLNQ
jgi:hypothetical protein